MRHFEALALVEAMAGTRRSYQCDAVYALLVVQILVSREKIEQWARATCTIGNPQLCPMNRAFMPFIR